tara:strand:+ start:2248 stop:2841 length:594 start_codon:yes stop_codon:yes gene_type:complete
MIQASHAVGVRELSWGTLCAGWAWMYCLSLVMIAGQWRTLSISKIFGSGWTVKHCYQSGALGLIAGGIGYYLEVFKYIQLPHHWDTILPYVTLNQQMVLMLGLLLSPILEGVLFQGVILAALERRAPGPTCCLISAYLWALPFSEGLSLVFAVYLVLGYVLAQIRLKHQSIWSPLWAHVIFNALCFSGVISWAMHLK